MASRFEANNDASWCQSLKFCHEAVMLDARIGYGQASPPPTAGHFDQDLIAGFGDIDGDEDRSRRCRIGSATQPWEPPSSTACCTIPP